MADDCDLFAVISLNSDDDLSHSSESVTAGISHFLPFQQVTWRGLNSPVLFIEVRDVCAVNYLLSDVFSWLGNH
jgi:hypothetical protein